MALWWGDIAHHSLELVSYLPCSICHLECLLVFTTYWFCTYCHVMSKRWRIPVFQQRPGRKNVICNIKRVYVAEWLIVNIIHIPCFKESWNVPSATPHSPFSLTHCHAHCFISCSFSTSVIYLIKTEGPRCLKSFFCLALAWHRTQQLRNYFRVNMEKENGVIVVQILLSLFLISIII